MYRILLFFVALSACEGEVDIASQNRRTTVEERDDVSDMVAFDQDENDLRGDSVSAEVYFSEVFPDVVSTCESCHSLVGIAKDSAFYFADVSSVNSALGENRGKRCEF